MPIVLDRQSLFWCIAGIAGSSIVSFYISWLFSGRYRLVADIVTVPSCNSKFSKNVKIDAGKEFGAWDTYVVLKNHGNHCLQMSDFAPLNMPHIEIAEGKLQRRQKPYYVLPNPDPFAMYNNVQLSDNGDRIISITFDLLKAGQNMEIVVHSLVPLSRRAESNLYVGATLKDGDFIGKKQMMFMRSLVYMLTFATLLPMVVALPMIPEAAKGGAMIAMVIWDPVSVILVNLISYYGARRKIVSR